MARSFVSVLIDTYNHERFIAQAIESVLEQDFPLKDMEIVVVDDGSTDQTGLVARKFAPRVRYLLKPNGGQASAFNFGIPQTHSEIVAFLDGDDWWDKAKLQTVLDTFGRNPGVGAVGHGYYQVDTDGRMLQRVVPDKTYRLHLKDREGAQLFDRLKGFLGTSKVAIRRAVLERVLPVPEDLVYEADEFIWTLVVALSDAIVLDQPLFYYRFHTGNLFMTQHFDEEKAWRRYRIFTSLLKQLPSRLEAFGILRELIPVALASLQVDVERHRLSLEGGKPWETFLAERTADSLAYRDSSLGYRLFKAFVMLLTLVMPPRQFYGLRRWYAAMGLHKHRRLIGKPTPAVPVTIHRV